MSSGQPSDRRTEFRRRVLHRAVLAFNEGKSSVTGLIRDLSSSGAKFVTDHEIDLPSEATLLYSDETEQSCIIIPRPMPREFGLRFLGPRRLSLQGRDARLSRLLGELRSISPHRYVEICRRSRYLGDEVLRSHCDAVVRAYDFVLAHLTKRLGSSSDEP